MIRSAAALALLALALMPAGATAQTELNILPHGQHQPGAQWATAPGMLPPNAQALMYDRLTPLGRNITPAVMQPSFDGSGHFKSARMLPADDPSLITDETITSGNLSARIRRDAYGVPHIYSSTDAGAIFGAGHVLAQDRTLLLDQGRDNGMAAAIDMPGVSAIELVLGLYDYEPSARVRRQAVRQQTRALRRSGAAGMRPSASSRPRIAGLSSALLTAAFIFATIAGVALFGSRIAFQAETSKFFSPCSSVVGRSGCAEVRLPASVASALTCPAFTAGAPIET
jgi:hypothetical protein